MLWVPTFGGAPARAPGGCVFEEQVGVGVHNARVSEKYRCWVYSRGNLMEFYPSLREIGKTELFSLNSSVTLTM